MRMSPMSPLYGLLLACGIWACASPSSTRCADGTICPAGLRCIEGTCISSNCGNGIIDVGEVCDDGNNLSGDGCNLECSSDERCGNAIFDPNEQCDCGDGAAAGPMPLGCTGPNSDSGGLCTSTCRLHCGDGVLNAEEDCDGAPPEGLYCVDFGYDTGLLECSDFCTVVGGEGCVSFGWRRLPSATRANLRAIWGSSSNDIYAAGWDGTLVRYDGRLWQPVIEGLWEERLYSIWGRAADDIHVAGDDGLILHYDGVAWTEATRLTLPGDVLPDNPSADINALWAAPGSASLIAVGDTGRIWRQNGQEWTLEYQWQPGGVAVDLHALWGSSDTDIYAVGDDFSLLHYDGTSWSAVTTGLTRPPINDDTEDDFNAVWGSSASDVYAVGDQGTVWHYNGTSWSAVALPALYQDAMLRAVWGDAPDNIFLAGEDSIALHFNGTRWVGLRPELSDHFYAFWGTSSAELYVVGNNGAIARHTGRAWAQFGPLTDLASLPVQVEIRDAWGTGVDDIYAVGDDGLVLHYDGRDWSAVELRTASGQALGITRDLLGIWGTDTANGPIIFIVGDNGTALRFTVADGWSDMTIGELGTRDLYDVWGASPDDVYAVGQNGSMVHYQGTSWQRVNMPTVRDLLSVRGTAADNVYAVSEGDDLARIGSEILHHDGATWTIVHITDDDELNTIWATATGEVHIGGGDGVLLRPQDNDFVTIDPSTAQDIHGIWSNSLGELFAVGSNGAMVYYDGLNWQPVRTDTFARLNALWGTDEVTLLVGREGVVEMLVRTDR